LCLIFKDNVQICVRVIKFATGCRIPVVQLLWEQSDGVQFSAPRQMDRKSLITQPQQAYQLIDSGGEEKLERFGDVLLVRPDPQALWPKANPEAWKKANGVYVKEGKAKPHETKSRLGSPDTSEVSRGKWTGNIPTSWPIEFGGLTLIVKPTSFKHTGIFPEQLPNWEFIVDSVKKSLVKGRDEHDPNSLSKAFSPRILNLFGYTGGATLAAAKAGAEVTHVDASKSAVSWARENATSSGLADKRIHWIVEDVMTYVTREIKRGSKYDAIIMDPPAFGHGPKSEIWKIEEHLVELIGLCKQLLSDKPIFFLINGYAEGYSPLAFAYNLTDLKEKYGGEVTCGDLHIKESGQGRLLPAGIFARWSN
jgi:23S rRNA (cytosine1962-C5)-methyltransferase